MHGEGPLSPERLGRVAAALGQPLDHVRALSGGDINQAELCATPSGPVFVKWNGAPAPRMFEAEAEGLAALRAADALPVPEVLAVGPDFLVQEYLPEAAAADDYDERLGRGMAALHAVRGLRFGFHQDNVLGTLSQHNAWADSWVAFFRHRRLEPLAARATAEGAISPTTRRALDELGRRLGHLIPAGPAPSRLHGDLWAGNVLTAPDGGPVLIDPAVYHGHREVDLAMTELFGGFSPRFYAAYREAWPLEPGYERRREVYQVIPLLVHVILFGGPYEAQLLGCLKRLA